jgi:H+/Cl- antiporter ClcA
VQMGGALADQLTRWLPLQHEDRRVLLMAGMAAGFASVFGTPLAGAVFALEVLVIGQLRYDALLACVVAAVVGDQTTLWWGIHHTPYAVAGIPALSLWGLTATVLAGILFGLVGRLFTQAHHRLSAWVKRHVAYPPLRPMLGGMLIATALWGMDGWRYAGLGIPVIMESFQQPGAPWDFAAKLVFTVVSLGTGFKGGEVTPLFYIGATLGNAVAPLLHMPFPLLAALGLVAVFAGAAKTPLACTLMAMELFGAEIGVYALLACVFSYGVSGRAGIYSAQR